jgi:hypothetical protein
LASECRAYHCKRVLPVTVVGFKHLWEDSSMRALCGAVITAGAMIGLGLTAIGFGTRYHTGLENVDKDGNPILPHLDQMDKPLVFILVFMTITALIGLGIAFVGLAYHHHRRHHEMLHAYGRAAGQTRALP